MGPGKFEDSIREKFVGQTKKTPDSIWTNIENELNAELVSIYASQHLMYKWVSIAAVIIAVLLLGVIYSPSFIKNSQEESASYNAFLSNDIDYNNYYTFHTKGYQSLDLSFDKMEPKPSQSELIVVQDSKPQSSYEIKGVERKRPELVASIESKDIYRYYQAGSGLSPRKSNESLGTKVWAGVEAGAGTFNSSFGKSGAVSNSLNPGALASALGSGNFVNPTTNITEDMDQGIATTIGVDFGVQLGKKWTLESGLAYTNMDNSGTASINVLDVYTIDNNDFIDSSNGISGEGSPSLASREATIEVRENFDHEVELNNNIQIASIPLKAGYFVVNKKFSLRLNAGLSANYLVDGSISDPTKQILNSNDLSLYNDWSFDGVGGLELGYSIFNKFNFTIEPNYRHSITPISDAINSPSRFVLQTGLRYTLK
ncbi:outer membrane beta-barrel protein [Ekhidna sp.]|uniref:outer membrane beta-barrel protein n=1 Tax=Ekhidna sp. TaxID=2608089 RepID=UPI00329782FE